jgi:hypothetical protein
MQCHRKEYLEKAANTNQGCQRESKPRKLDKAANALYVYNTSFKGFDFRAYVEVAMRNFAEQQVNC